MSLAHAAAIPAAAALAGAAYLDGRFQLRNDLRKLYDHARFSRKLDQAAKKHRVSSFCLFDQTAARYPSHTSIWSRSGTYTYREVHNRACQYAAFFLSKGVQPGDLVAFYLYNAPEMLFAWLGLWAIGCAPALINYNLAKESLVHCVKISGAKLMLVDEDAECQERIANERARLEGEVGAEVVTLSEELKREIASLSATTPSDGYRDKVLVSSPAMLIFTSGTTGLPKAYPFVHGRTYLSGLASTVALAQKPGPGGDRWYDCMPMYHGTGAVVALCCLLSGVSLAIGRKFSLGNFWRDVRDADATMFVYVGEAARYLLHSPPSPLDRAHRVRCIWGNGMRPDVWRPFQQRFGIAEVAEFFNSTEGMFSLASWDRNGYGADCVGHHGLIARALLRRTYVPVATDPETGDIYRDPKTGFAVRKSYAEGGEMIVRVPPTSTEFAGYWKAPEASAQKFVRDVFAHGDLFYRTGDALRRSPDGHWHFLDRLGDTFRWKSENVSTAEVAEVLGRFPGIHEANVYGVLVPKHDGRAGCAAVVLDGADVEGFDWARLARYAREKLPKYAVPVFVRVTGGGVGGMATHNSKQNKVPLRSEGVDPALRGSKVEGGEGDRVFWLRTKGKGYVEFRGGDWVGLEGGRERL